MKNLPAMQEISGSIPGSGRSPGEGNGSSIPYFYLDHPMDRGAWRITVHGVAKSRTQLSTKHTFKSRVHSYELYMPQLHVWEKILTFKKKEGNPEKMVKEVAGGYTCLSLLLNQEQGLIHIWYSVKVGQVELIY